MIRVKLVAPFKIELANREGELELPERTSVGKMLRTIHCPVYAFLLPITVNGVQVSKGHRLQDGDLVIFVMPFSGG